jgi:predicted phage baseplate assembly protein
VFVTDLALRSDTSSVLPLDLGDVPALLDVGRTLIIAGKHDAMEVIVKEVETNPNRIKVAPAIPGSELTADGTTQNYTRYHTLIYGNVIHAGHGETQKPSILGTGDATQTHQTFNADAKEVSFVADRNFPPGVRAAIEITVDSRTWKQVATLNDSEPEDPHYTARIKEDGTLSVQFGDGFRGRRLPSGTNNVRMVHRKGAGLAGNLATYSLQKAVKPHALVDAIVQPIASTGGNDMETVESMRDHAPASVLTLERAVSLADFTHLAATNSSVWQARAFRRQPGVGRVERIEVAVVPAGGGSLGALGDSLQAFLTAHALPGVKITIIPYQSVILDLKLTLRIKEEEYDPDLVAKAVNQAVLAAFSLKNAKLGKPLYQSDVFAVVEGVAGVANCHCEISPNGFRDATGATITPKQVARGADGIIRRVSIAETQVIYMDNALSVLEIVTQAFSL